MSRHLAMSMCVLLCGAIAAGQDSVNQSEITLKVDSLRSQFADANRQPDNVSRSGVGERLTIEALAQLTEQQRNSQSFGGVYKRAVEELSRYLHNSRAVQALINTIDEPPSPAPNFTQSPLEHLYAASTLSKGGDKVRGHLLEALKNVHSARKLHIIALVLARIDQSEGRPFSARATMQHLIDEAQWVQDNKSLGDDSRTIRMRNIKYIMSLLVEPQFHLTSIPQ